MADSTHPLSDSERLRLRAAFVRWPTTIESHLTHLIWSTAAHPTCAGDPKTWGMRVEGKVLSWHRAKTDERISVPIDPELWPWLEDHLAQLRVSHIHPVNVAKLVHHFGDLAGVEGLTPRGLRHDRINQWVEKKGVVVARELSGTSTDVLMGYARRKLAADLADQPGDLFS